MITDYTQKSTFIPGFPQQYRIMKYFKDILNNWFADSKNIEDERIALLLYDKKGELNKDCIKTGTAFNSDRMYTGTTPAIVISIGDISYTRRSIGPGTPLQYQINPMTPQVSDFRFKNIPVEITVITQNHDGTVLLAQLIQSFLEMNCQLFVQDNKSLSAVNVIGVSRPSQIKAGQAGNAKDLYASQISLNTVSALVWKKDSQGPVFKGLTNINIK